MSNNKYFPLFLRGKGWTPADESSTCDRTFNFTHTHCLPSITMATMSAIWNRHCYTCKQCYIYFITSKCKHSGRAKSRTHTHRCIRQRINNNMCGNYDIVCTMIATNEIKQIHKLCQKQSLLLYKIQENRVHNYIREIGTLTNRIMCVPVCTQVHTIIP